MDAAQRLVICIDQTEIAIDQEGARDPLLMARLQGESQAYRHALAVLVGEKEAVAMLQQLLQRKAEVA